MGQRAVPSAPDYPGNYVISGFRAGRGDNVIVEVVTDQLQRLFVAIRSKHSDTDEIDATIRHALAGLHRPPNPVR